MARKPAFKPLIAREAYENFAAIIRPQQISEQVAAQWESAFGIESDLRKSNWPGHLLPHDPTVAEVGKPDLTTFKFDTLPGSQPTSTVNDALLDVAMKSSKQNKQRGVPRERKLNMKNRMIVAVTLLTFATVACVRGDSTATDGGPGDLYRANELSLDAFGSIAFNETTFDNISGEQIRDDARMGAGLGLNYFFTRHVGIGGEAFSEDTDGIWVDNTSGSLFLRIPLGQSGVAPYAFGGGGHKFEPVEEATGHAGAGLECRFSPHFGIFVDGRYVFADETMDYGLGRFGLRFAF